MYQEMFENMAVEQGFDDVDHMADAFEQLVSELEFNDLREASLAHQAVGDYLDAVDWEDIAEKYFVVAKEDDDQPHDYASEMRCRVGN